MPQAVAAVITAAQAAYAAAVSTIAGPLVAVAGEGAAIAIATNIVNAGILFGISTGINAIARSGIPDPDFAASNRKQTIPDRMSGYGRARLGGAFMLWEASGDDALNVLALHDGRCDGVEAIYLNDETVTVLGSGFVQSGSDLRYGKFSDLVQIDTRLGLDTETRYSQITDTSLWPTNARGDGIASLMMIATSEDQKHFIRDYPNGLPLPSAVVRMQIVYDARLGERDDPLAWVWSQNPAWQLLDYMTNAEQGMGLDYDRYFAPNIAQWITAADVCDEAVPLAAGGTVPRYTGDGTYLHSTPPADVIATILQCCDGWIAQDTGGAFVIQAGEYVATTVTITDAHIVGMDRQFYLEDERAVNELIISYTSPSYDYTEVESVPWRDEADILDRNGQVRSQRMSMPWVSTSSQARRLAKIAMARATAPIRGTITTTLYGLKAMGERRIRIQAPNDSAVMADIVVDVVSVTLNPDFTLTIPFVQTMADSYEWDAATEEETDPVITRPPPSFIETPGIAFAEYDPATMRIRVVLAGLIDGFYSIQLSWQAQDGNPPEQVEFPVRVEEGLDTVVYTTPTVPGGEIIDVRVALISSSGAVGDYSDTYAVSTPAITGNAAITEAADTVAGGAAVYDPDALAYFAAMSVQPDATRKGLINNFIVGLKADGVWSLLDLVYILASHDAQAARLNAKTPTSFAASTFGLVTFITGLGYTAINGGLDTGFSPSTAGGELTQNSASLFCWVNASSELSGAFETIGITAGYQLFLRPHTGSLLSARVNSVSNISFGATTTGAGSRCVSRTGASTINAQVNGATSGATSSEASSALIPGNVILLNQGSTNTRDRLALATIGGGLTGTQMTALHNRSSTFLTAIGAN